MKTQCRFRMGQLSKLMLTVAIATGLALGAAPARPQDTNQADFQASYQGPFTPRTGENGVIVIDTMMAGDATFLPGSRGLFTHFVDPANPTVLEGVFMLYGGGNGTVFGTYEGTQTPPDGDGVMLISGTYSIADGWLQGFGPAIGSGTFSGLIDVRMGEAAITLQGSVSPPPQPGAP